MVLEKIREETKDKTFIAKMVRAAHDAADDVDVSPVPIMEAISKLERKITGLADIVAETQNRALIAKLEETEAERKRLQEERAATAERAKLKKGLRSLTNQDVHAMLEFAAKPLDAVEPDIPYLRRTLAALVRRIELDPEARTTQVCYTLSGVGVASPRGFEPRLLP